MRSKTPLSLEGHCARCYLHTTHCICAKLPKLDTSLEVLIIRHKAERRLTSNTGRLAALCLNQCRIIEYSACVPFNDAALPLEGAVLLYPGDHGTSLSLQPRRLVVLDATFRQARRMFKRIHLLRHIPQLALSAPKQAPNRLRKPPHADGMSTIEAIALALAALESEQVANSLLQSYALFVEQADRQRGRIREGEPAAGSENLGASQASSASL